MKGTMDSGMSRLIRTAVVLALIGLLLVLLFLCFGFRPWSMGIGVFLGGPVLLSAVVLYIIAVIGDLRRRDVL